MKLELQISRNTEKKYLNPQIELLGHDLGTEVENRKFQILTELKFSKDFDKHELSYSFLSKCEHITGNIKENNKSKFENVSYKSKIILSFLRHQRELQRNLNLDLFVERDELMWLGGKILSLTDDNHRLIINLYENELIKTVNQINTIQDKGYQKEYLFLVKDYKFMFF